MTLSLSPKYHNSIPDLVKVICVITLFASVPPTIKAQTPAAPDCNGSDKVSWSKNGELIAVAGCFGVLLYARDLESYVRLPDVTQPAYGMAWSDDSTNLAIGNADNTVGIWNVRSRQLISMFRGHNQPVYDLSWSPDGKKIASLDQGNTVKVWTIADSRVLYTLNDTIPIWAIAWSPDGTTLATGGAISKDASNSGDYNGWIKLWNAANSKLLKTFPGPLFTAVSDVQWSNDGKTLASLGTDKVGLWSATGEGEGYVTCDASAGSPTAMVLSPDGAKIAIAGMDAGGSALCISDLNDHLLTSFGLPIYTFGSLSWSPDGKSVALAAGDGSVRIIDAVSGDQTAYALTPNASLSSLSLLLGLCVDEQSQLYDVLSHFLENNQTAQFIAAVKAQAGKEIKANCAADLINMATPFLAIPTATPKPF